MHRPFKVRPGDVERFRALVVEGKEARQGLGPCLEWSGRRLFGYGYFLRWRAHRFAWCVERGDPGDMMVLHNCDNPACVRVEHLFLGTQADNMADKARKGRAPRGDANNARRVAMPSGATHWTQARPELLERECYKAAMRSRDLGGEKNGRARLTKEDVRRIREIGSSVSQQSIADTFGMSQTAISKILAGDTWKGV